MRIGWGCLLLAGCPWVTGDEHDANVAAVDQSVVADTDTDTDADSDADADADSDADTDTDTDTGTIPTGCIDDAYEPNNAPLTAYSASLPATLDGMLCPDDISIDGVTDYYRVTVGLQDVLTAVLQEGATTACTDQQVLVEVIDAATFERYGFDRSGTVDCARIDAGYGPGDYLVQVTSESPATEQDYQLDLSVAPCADFDNDDFVSIACGGPDCNDASVAVNPDAFDTPGDSIDQDCDGGDELAFCAPTTGVLAAASDDLPCGDTEIEPVWDKWEFFAPMNHCISVVLDNDADAADLLAFVVDEFGTNYGLSDPAAELDDEWDCSTDPWSDSVGDFGCPRAGVTVPFTGFVEVWVAQRSGSGCVPGAGYTLDVYDNGSAVTPGLAEDDTYLVRP